MAFSINISVKDRASIFFIHLCAYQRVPVAIKFTASVLYVFKIAMQSKLTKKEAGEAQSWW